MKDGGGSDDTMKGVTIGVVRRSGDARIISGGVIKMAEGGDASEVDVQSSH